MTVDQFGLLLVPMGHCSCCCQTADSVGLALVQNAFSVLYRLPIQTHGTNMWTKHKPGPLEALWQHQLKREREEHTAFDDAPVNSNAATRNSTATRNSIVGLSTPMVPCSPAHEIGVSAAAGWHSICGKSALQSCRIWSTHAWYVRTW